MTSVVPFRYLADLVTVPVLADGRLARFVVDEADPGRPVIAGTPAEVTDIVGRYREAGADELIFSDATFGSGARKKETCDLLMTEVAPAFRPASA